MEDLDTRRFPALDGLRTYVILLVALHHAWFGASQPRLDGGVLRDVVASGFLWFEVFFLVSGFVLMLPVARSGRLEVRRFWRARALRILPLWWFVLLVISIVAPTATKFFIPRPWHLPGFKLYLANLTLLHLPIYGLPAGGLFFDVVVWTLSIELVFYVVMPLLAPLVRRAPVTVALVGVVVSREWVIASTHLERWWPASWIPNHTRAGIEVARAHAAGQFPTYLGHFCLGMAAAVLVVRHRDGAVVVWLRQHADLVMVGGLVLALGPMVPAFRDKAGGHWTAYDNYTRTGIALPGLVLLCVGIAFAGPLGRRVFGNPVVVLFGVEAVYGFYLWHVFLMDLTTYAFGWASDGSTGIFVVRLATIPITIAVTLVGRQLIEKPALRLAKPRTMRVAALAAVP